jgi:2-polyprenyl-3-methyl-5-hydroxy-6-metoxy-1,4-benzoquinol methylase
MLSDAKHRGGRFAARLKLIDDPDESWREFGRSDPYFGVLSDERYRAANLDEAALAAFFATGEEHVAGVMATIGKYLGAPGPAGEALDFGCGVGRLVLPLARRFESVVGVDISDAYLEEAAWNRDRAGLSNVTFAGSLEALKGRQFDLVHSYIVFNHIPWIRGKSLIGDLFALIRPGGAMALHVLHHRKAGPLRRAASWARRNFLPLHWLTNLMRRRPVFEPLMQGNRYPLDELLPFLAGLGAEGLHLRFEPAEGGDVFAFVFLVKGRH